jgi:hypothetical protein
MHFADKINKEIKMVKITLDEARKLGFSIPEQGLVFNNETIGIYSNGMVEINLDQYIEDDIRDKLMEIKENKNNSKSLS